MQIPFPGNRIDLRWGSSTAATAETTTARAKVSNLVHAHRSFVGLGVFSQLRVELAGGATLLALTSVTSSVSTLTVATVATTATATERSAALLVAEHATGRGVRSLLLDVGGGDDLGGEVEPLAEVVETLRGEGVVV